VFEPDAPQGNTITLQDKDLRFETLRASGPGGQHVNKTDSAVRATHLPSGLCVKVQTERSQHANKRLARALLAHKLASASADVINAAREARWLQHYDVERGNAGRVFKGIEFKESR
jgi:peptide chain release factor